MCDRIIALCEASPKEAIDAMLQASGSQSGLLGNNGASDAGAEAEGDVDGLQVSEKTGLVRGRAKICFFRNLLLTP